MSEHPQSLLNNFKASEHEEATGFEVLPAGRYKVMIEANEVKESKKTPGALYEQLTYTVLEGDHKGRKFWHILNLGHPKQDVRKIAEREATSIIMACFGFKKDIGPISDVFNIPHFVDLAVEPRKDKPGEHNNRINKWLHLSKGDEAVSTPPPAKVGAAPAAAAPAAAAAAPATTPPAPPPGTPRNGWMTKKPAA